MTLCAEISMEVKVPNTDLFILGHATQGKLGLNKLAAAGGMDEGSNFYWANFLTDSARITISRGRTDTDPTALVQAGVATADVFGNTWDPSQTEIMVPGRDVRITQGSTTLWSGKVWDTTTHYDEYKQAYTTITCYDSTRDLFNTVLDSDLESVQTVTQRLSSAMGSGYAVSGTTSASLAPKQATTVGEILSLIQASELGFTYVDKSGTVQVRARTHTKPAVSVGFSDNHNTKRNLLTINQATVETDTTGFIPSGTYFTVSRSTAEAAEGSASLLVTTTGVGSVIPGTMTATSGTPVEPNKTYTAFVSVKSPDLTNNAHIRIYWYKADGFASSTTMTAASNIVLSNTWSNRVLTATAPADAAYAAVRLVGTATAAGQRIYLDKFGLFEGTETAWLHPNAHQCYTDIGLAYDTEDIWNAVDISNYAGLNGYGQDVVDQYKAPGEAVSVATYGEHLLSATTNLDTDANDNQITAWRQAILDRYASPARRVKSITYHPWDNGTLKNAGVDVGDTVYIDFHDEFGTELTAGTYTVYGVNHQIEPNSWQTTLVVGP